MSLLGLASLSGLASRREEFWIWQRLGGLRIYRRGRRLEQYVYRITGDGRFAKDYGLRDQIRRASVSIMANIAEGFARRSDKDFAYFLNISRSSAAEVQSHLYVALDQEYVNEIDFNEIYNGIEETSKMIFALARHLAAR
ncbi:MAG TPA: four helix bundle protein [Pyrinomonadaceae bacterium]|nr:four helix bundle protein [Pyrinomonadaceae bacterium]